MPKMTELGKKIDGAKLRNFAGKFVTGIAVIAARAGDGIPRGLTMNAVTSLSLDPPLFLICLANNSNTLTAVLETKAFAINFLGSHQNHIAKKFASKDADKFNGIEYYFGKLQCPIISDALAVCECQVDAIHPGGDHQIVVGVVEEIRDSGGYPLIFHKGKIVTDAASGDLFCPVVGGEKLTLGQLSK